MTETAVAGQPAFILRHRKYRETSLILDVFTRDFGIIGILAKGVRKTKSKTAGLLLPFNALLIAYQGKTELKILTQVEAASPEIHLSGLGLYCGFYLNELMTVFCHRDDPQPEVFADYLASLAQLANIKLDAAPNPAEANNSLSPLLQLEATLRLFEVKLMQHIGLALLTQHDARTEQPINTEANYHVIADQGVIEDPQGHFSGKTIQALNNGAFTDPQTLREAKNIMRTVINFHLHGKALKSRAILSQIYKQI